MFEFLRIRHFAAATLLLLGLLFLITPALAQDDTVTDDDVNAVAKGLFCPVCESTPLDVCATQACADWRELIRQQLSEGQTPEEIHEYFAVRYGDGVLANPPKRGFNLILWLFPAAAVLLGGLFFSRFMSGLRSSAAGKDVEEVMAVDEGTAVSPPSQPLSKDDYKAKLEEELRSR